MDFSQQNLQLTNWYHKNSRDLPWRKDRNPYKIWISEVMLQQTTVVAVIPYFLKFINRFPSIIELASSSLDEVYQYWAGLGYYSRARNIHRAAQQIMNDLNGIFPKTSEELIQLPGFGPYTANAVASFAFDEPIGVLDGNVIRVLSRLFNKKWRWWESKQRTEMQNISTHFAKVQKSYNYNQAIMELGATICTPKNPTCILCPLKNTCLSCREGTQLQLPLAKSRKENEVWIWQPVIYLKKNKIALIKNNYAPFLKGSWLFPGTAKKLTDKPSKFNFKHSITHHQIFVKLKLSKKISTELNAIRWTSLDELEKINPSSLLQKTLGLVEK
jgi:A/G-specific adenine glycosylase